jgi:hypothetical protein
VSTRRVRTLNELIAALDGRIGQITITAAIVSPHDIVLPDGVSLSGEGEGASLLFSEGGGLGLTRNNSVQSLRLLAAAKSRAIYLQAGAENFGTITLEDLTVTGQIGLIARVGCRSGHVAARNVHVAFADARAFPEQPQKYGVNVLQGAFTLFNQNGDAGSRLTATLDDISAGSTATPVFGSGIFVGGFGDEGGGLEIDRLTTGEVCSTGLLPFGTADFITGGVFVLYGCTVAELVNKAPCRTYGVNDMVLDNWGKVERWTAQDVIESYGPSGIGFVNFGTVEEFRAEAPIRTYGLGARGFNQYDGTVKSLRLDSIETFGDGSIGIQISKPVGRIRVDRDVRTHGGTGPSLVKGVIATLAAEAFSVKPSGDVEQLQVGGDIVTEGDKVDAFTVEGGAVRHAEIKGSIKATGAGSKRIRIENGGSVPDNLTSAELPESFAAVQQAGAK